MLPIAPGELLRPHAALAAVRAPPAIQEESQKTPQRDELEAPLGKRIIAWRRLVATRTDLRGALPGPHGHFDGLLVGAEAGMLVDGSPVMMAVAENRGQFHGADDGEEEKFQGNPPPHAASGRRCFRLWPGSGSLAAVMDGGGEGRAAGRRTGRLPRAFYRASGLIQPLAKDYPRHLDNLWLLGGEIIRDLDYDPSPRRLPADRLLGREGALELETGEDFYRSTCSTGWRGCRSGGLTGG